VPKKNLFTILQEYTRKNPRPSGWNSTSITDFISKYYKEPDPDRGQQATNAAFWYLVIFGVLALDTIGGDEGDWDAEEKELWWVDMQQHVYLTGRGMALLQKIKTIAENGPDTRP
jgi:hypothetical protein